MRRCYLGAVVLAALLLLGIFSSRWMENHHRSLAEQLLSAADAAEAGEWEEFLRLTSGAEGDWHRNRGLTAVLADHQYLEQAEGLLGQLPSAAKRREAAECARLCRDTAHIFRVLAEDQKLKWENLL